MMGEEKLAYLLNMDNILEFIFENDSEKNGDSQITELYVMDEKTKNMSLSTKQLTEIKSGDMTTAQTVRYDLLKLLLDRLMNIQDEELTFGETVVVNTMLASGLITEIKESDL